MRIITATAVAAAIAAPAGAACFDAGDLGRGIVATYDTGDSTTLRRISDGTILVDESYADGRPPMRFHAHHGIYFAEEYEPDPVTGAPLPGTRLVVDFGVDPRTLPRPAAGVTWTGPTTNVYDDGVERAETTTVSFAPGPPLALGGCTYDTLRADLRYDWGAEGGLSLDYLYLVDLGAGLILSNKFDGEKGSAMVPVDLQVFTK